MEILIFALELAGTAAFGVSGAMTGIKKGMDVFGVVILGIVTAVCGGVIRDLILGCTPPATFQYPVYAAVAAAASLAVFFPAVRGLLFKNRRVYDPVMLIMDSLGLGIFTAIGVQAAVLFLPESSLFLRVFVGVMTGVGGGVLRDVLSGDTPYIFVKHIYACASIAGALACALLWEPAGRGAAVLTGAALVFLLRLAAAKWRWSLPRAKVEL